MSSKKKNNFFNTLAFRLTLLYTVLFVVSTVVAFVCIYMLTSKALIKQVDEDLLDDVEEFSVLYLEEDIAALQEEFSQEAEGDGEESVFFRLFDYEGKTLFTTNLDAWGDLEDGASLARRYKIEGRPLFSTITIPDTNHKARTIVAPLSDTLLAQFGESLEESESYLAVFVEIFTETMLFVIIIATLCGWLMARRALSGVEEVTRTALRISKGEFTQRVPIKLRGYEIERLASAFNYMIDRIQSLLNGIREVTDNIAHDLRSPITSMRGTAETTLMNGSDIDDFKAMAGNTVEECDRLLSMVNSMLDISEAEAGVSKMEIEDIDLSQVVRQACDIFLPIAEEKELSLAIQAPHACNIRGDLKKIQRLISNLLDNALKYTPTGGTISIEVSAHEKERILTIEDNGIGIDENDLPYIFHRFYRCDNSRSQAGCGLGLSLAQAIVTAHAGQLNVFSTPGAGSRFVVTLPETLS